MKLKYLKTIRSPSDNHDNNDIKFQKITSLAYSSNNYRFAISTTDRYILLYDENNEFIDKFPTKPATDKNNRFMIRNIEFSPDNIKIAIAQTDSIIYVFKLGEKFGDKKSICNKFPQTSPVTCLCWPKLSPNMLIFGTSEGKVRGGSITTNKSTTLYSHESHVVAISSSPDGRSFIAAHLDGSIFKYTFEDPEGKFGAHALLLQVNFVPYALSWGEAIAVGGNSLKVHFVNPNNGQIAQSFDYSNDANVKEFTCASFSPSGLTCVLGNFSRFHTYTFTPTKNNKNEWSEVPPTIIENLYTITAVRWKPDGSRFYTGSLGGYVDAYDACLKRYVHGNLFEFTYTSTSSVIAKRLSTNSKLELKTQSGAEIKKLSVQQEKYIVATTADSYIVADTELGLASEVHLNAAGTPKFFFDNPSVCMIYTSGELSIVEYGSNNLLGQCRTEYMSPHLISVRICPPRKNRDLSDAVKRIAYLLDLQTIRVLDLQSNQTICTINLDSKIDWLEMNQRGSKILFRDKRQALHIYDIHTQSRTTLLNFCNYVQWVPDSDVVVAQNRNVLSVWYSIENTDQMTQLTIKGDVEEIERGAGKTEVIIEQGNGKVRLPLDETLISFGAAVDEGDFEKAVETLETTNSTETPALWSKLSTLAIEVGNFLVAERAYAALGDASKVRFLREINVLGADMNNPLVQAKVAMLHKQFKRAEAVLIEQGRMDDAIHMYKSLHKWEDAVTIAETRGHPLAGELKSQYFEWLGKTNQEEIAGALKEREGSYLEAISLYLRGGHPAKAALLIQNEKIVHDQDLVNRVASSLIKQGQYEKAGDFFESLDRNDKALEAFVKGHSFRKAVELARRHFRSNVVSLEEQWGDWLMTSNRFDDACNHFIESGNWMKAIHSAIEARQWTKATQILDNVDPESGSPFFKRIADHYKESRNFKSAERYFLQGGLPYLAVKMYTEANMLSDAKRIAENTLSPEELAELYEEQARLFESEGKYAEAERLYLDMNEPDLAISMYKNNRNFDKMLMLVSQFRKEVLNDTYLHLAGQFMAENNLKQAEHYFLSAKDWKAVVNMYRERLEWDDALRVAKTHGGAIAYKQVAYASAVTLGGEAGVKLLSTRGLSQSSITYAIERSDFAFAFQIATLSLPSALPDIHFHYAMSLEDSGMFMKAEEEFMKANKPREAMEMYLHQHEWDHAERVAQHVEGGYEEVYEAQGNEEVEKKQFKNAEQHYIQAKKPELAIKMYKDQGLWEDSIRLASAYLPHLVSDLQTEFSNATAMTEQNINMNQRNSQTKVNAPKKTLQPQDNSEISGNPQLDQMAARGEWDRVFETVQKMNDIGLLHKFASIYANKLLSSGRNIDALNVFVKYGAAIVPSNILIYRQLIKWVLGERYLEANGDKECESNINLLREMLFRIVSDMKDSDAPSDLIKEFDRFLNICHYYSLKITCQRASLKEMATKLSVSLLRYTEDIAVDKAFYEAGNLCRDANQFGMAFVFFNRFTDICDLIDNPHGDPDNLDFSGSDIPVDNIPLPTTQAFSEEAREEVREWVVEQAISNRSSNSQSLTNRQCEKCSKQIFEGNLVCHSCKNECPPCIVTGYPVLKSKRINCKNCKMPANRDDWNAYVSKQKVCPWCGSMSNAIY